MILSRMITSGRWRLQASPIQAACRPQTHVVRQTFISQQTMLTRSTKIIARPFSMTAATRVMVNDLMIPHVFVPPLMFVGLWVTLWTWKCFWIIMMQDRLLYMSWMPPFARSETLEDYEIECRPVKWQETTIRSLDGTKLALCVGTNPRTDPGTESTSSDPDPLSSAALSPTQPRQHVVICYFQGNGGSMPPRLPILSAVLRALATTRATSSSTSISYSVLALSYRGYWKSSGRASQKGIERDAQALLDWVIAKYSSAKTDLKIILWGHSLGSAVASHTTATYLGQLSSNSSGSGGLTHPIAGIVLETPSTSTKDVLKHLYPQRWLPYRYLWPFLWNNWSSAAAMERIARWRDEDPGQRRTTPPILMLVAEADEMIPTQAADELEMSCQRLRLNAERKNVVGALHTEAVMKREGREALLKFIRRVAEKQV